MPRLSAIIIAKDEAANIDACLASVAFADERIVVDSGSNDATAEIARRSGARVVDHAFVGFGPQKNFALAQANGDWVLSIDADERVTPALEAEIKKAMMRGDVDAFEVPRQSSFLGRVMRHSGWYPDYVLRLFRRERARFSSDLVHERVICEGKILRLREPLVHTPVVRIEDAIARRDRYSTAGAQMLVASGRRVTFFSGYLHGLWTFIRTYILRAGFLDGREGYLLAVLNAQGSYYRYMKAWRELRRRG
ncbi:MAG: glycosyltransferase family 2 protein [Pseudolabrys sp.]|nr:glycosyltransferase family 2 protein [Pseudolabrys sp.]